MFQGFTAQKNVSPYKMIQVSTFEAVIKTLLIEFLRKVEKQSVLRGLFPTQGIKVKDTVIVQPGVSQFAVGLQGAKNEEKNPGMTS